MERSMNPYTLFDPPHHYKKLQGALGPGAAVDKFPLSEATISVFNLWRKCSPCPQTSVTCAMTARKWQYQWIPFHNMWDPYFTKQGFLANDRSMCPSIRTSCCVNPFSQRVPHKVIGRVHPKASLGRQWLEERTAGHSLSVCPWKLDVTFSMRMKANLVVSPGAQTGLKLKKACISGPLNKLPFMDMEEIISNHLYFRTSQSYNCYLDAWANASSLLRVSCAFPLR